MIHPIKNRLKPILGLILLCHLQTGCKVGPNFHSPTSPLINNYTETPLPSKTVATKGKGGNSQTFRNDQDIPLLWWELYHSEEINELVKVGLFNSPTLTAAVAAQAQARENWKAQIGNALFPAIDSSMQTIRQRYSGAQIGIPIDSQTFTLYNPAFNIAYTLDIWGGARRQIESLKAQIDYQHFQLVAARLTLTSNIVTTAINIASFNAQIKATNDLIGIQASILNVLKNQYRLGGIANTDVLTQQTLLEQTKATLPSLEKNLSMQKHAMSVLVGTFPDRPLPEIHLDKLRLPAELPLTLPSNLVRQRPDILAAEAQMHAACAQIGVATANLLPQLNLTGSDGWISTSWARLFNERNSVWSLAAQLSQPLFHGGALFAQKRGAIDAFKQSSAQYQQTVLRSFQNVADVLKAIETDAQALQAQTRAEEAALASLKLAKDQYRLGGVNFINLLNVQQQYQQARINRIQAQAARFADTAALFQALGGGWWQKSACAKDCVQATHELRGRA